jgi:hypothetical protein
MRRYVFIAFLLDVVLIGDMLTIYHLPFVVCVRELLV